MNAEKLSELRHLAFDAATSGLVIVDVISPDQPIVEVNTAFEKMSGYSRAEVLGRNCRFLQGPNTEPDTRLAIREAIVDNQQLTITLLNYRKNGEPFWNELHLAPMMDGAGVVRHYVGVQTDVTAYRRASLRTEILAEASAILSSSPSYEATLGRVAQLILTHLADRCTLDVVDGGGRRRLVDLAKRSPENAAGPIANLSNAGISVPLVARGQDVGTLTLEGEGTGRLYDDQDRELARELGNRIAATIDNALLLSDAEAAVRTRDQFLSIAAHEFRTPISSIKGYAQLLLRGDRRGTLSPERIRRSSEVIDHATDRLKVLTDDLLDVSRIRLGRLPLRKRRVDFYDMVRELMQRYVQTFGTAHQLSLAMPDDSCWVDADLDRMQQVVTNLIENAVKHSAEGDPITVKVGQEETRVTFEVVDSGIGLSADSMNHLFEPFARAPNAIDLNVPGLGLGLYISRGIVVRHGGEIWADSAGEGQGARFGFWLPCQPDPAEDDNPDASQD